MPAPVARRESWLRRWFFRQRHVDPEPLAVVERDPEPLAWYDPDPGQAPEPVAAPWDQEPEAPEPEEPEEPAIDADRAQAVLEEALDTLGAAHHRPFSREG